MSEHCRHFLFDVNKFDLSLLEADTHQTKLKVFKEQVNQLNESLFKWFKKGSPIEDLVSGRAFVIDEILLRVWSIFVDPADTTITLVAVGGYGRGELHPHSDIDLMILLKKNPTEEYKVAIQKFFTFLWDMKLVVGHSVRTIPDCKKEARKDITVTTNMMEARLLVGSDELFSTMKAVTSPGKIWPSEKFFSAKWEEQVRRHKKYHDTAYNLEPNIKEGPGGLRDIQMIGWVAKRHFDAETLHNLVDYHFLNNKELAELIEGQTFLWRIRFALHMITGRSEDRLLFDYQKELARLFGYEDTHIIAVEQFMQKYYKTVMNLERLNEMLLQLFQEVILYAHKSKKTKPINNFFQSNLGFLEVNRDTVFQERPTAILEVFLLLQTHPKLTGVRASTIRLIRESLYLIDDKFRQDAQAKKIFIDIIKQPHGLTHELRRMNRYGVLAAYLPVFANIVGRMQYDMFHAYTVDEHTLFVVRNLRRFTVPEFANEFPFCSELISNIPKPEVLYISGLYHDIAKGRQGNHSTLGAIDVRAFCLDHKLSADDADIAAWLVENHLLMSSTAQRKDISDPKVINKFASAVKDKTSLDYLYLLTVADIRATNPTLWNTWKDSLLMELYRATKTALLRGLDQPLAQQERISSVQQSARELLLQSKLSNEQIDSVWKDFNKNYFLRYHPQEVSWHTQEILQTDKDSLPIVKTRNTALRGSTSIFIYTADKDYLFATTTAVLEQLNLNIQDARITTAKNGFALNTYLVLDHLGKSVQDETQLRHIVRVLKEGLVDDKISTRNPISRLPVRQHEFMQRPTKITIEQDTDSECTLLMLRTMDRRGLLARVGQAFKKCKIKLLNARIATFGEMAEDTFIITNNNNEPLSQQQEQDNLVRTLHQLLG